MKITFLPAPVSPRSALSSPCPSCPFLPTNFKEFNVVAERLCAKHGQPKPDFWACLSIRENVKNDAIKGGRLQCHCTVYDAQMNLHPEAARPCAGLAAYQKPNVSEPSRRADTTAASECPSLGGLAQSRKPLCADCAKRVGKEGPPDGWQLEDGRTVCHACCVKDTRRIMSSPNGRDEP